MSNCLQCKKELIQTPGKKAKKFCGPTCRSNYWYERNKRPTRQSKKEAIIPPKKETRSKNEALNTPTRPFMNEAIKKKLGIK